MTCDIKRCICRKRNYYIIEAWMHSVKIRDLEISVHDNSIIYFPLDIHILALEWEKAGMKFWCLVGKEECEGSSTCVFLDTGQFN